MRKFYKLLIITILLFTYSNVSALTKSELKTLNLKRVKTYNIESGYNYVQGAAVTDKYIVFAEIYSDTGTTALKIMDKNTFKPVSVDKTYNFGHANDMAYNKKNNKIIIVAGSTIKKVYILNGDTLKLEKTINTTRGYSSIGYDEVNNQYIARTGQYAFVLDLNFTEVRKFKMSSENLTTQGIGVRNGKIYYTCYEAGRTTTYQPVYDGVLKKDENVVFVYDIKTNKKEKVYYIPHLTKENIYPGEVEGIDFIGNKPIIWSNNNGKINLFMPAVDTLNTDIELNVSDSNIDLKNKDIILQLYKNNKLVSQTNNIGNKFIFNNLSFNDEQEVVYQLKISNKNYILNTNNLKIEIYYDFYTNTLKINYDKNISLTNTAKNKPAQNNNNNTNIDTDKKETDTNNSEENSKSNELSSNNDNKINSNDETTSSNNSKIERQDDIDNTIHISNDDISALSIVEKNDLEVQVPNTSTKSYTSIIGILFILCSVVLLKLKSII